MKKKLSVRVNIMTPVKPMLVREGGGGRGGKGKGGGGPWGKRVNDIGSDGWREGGGREGEREGRKGEGRRKKARASFQDLEKGEQADWYNI